QAAARLDQPLCRCIPVFRGGISAAASERLSAVQAEYRVGGLRWGIAGSGRLRTVWSGLPISCRSIVHRISAYTRQPPALLLVRANPVHGLVGPASDRPAQGSAVAEAHLPGDIVHAHARRLQILQGQLAPDIVDDRSVACVFGRKAASQRPL